MLATIKDEIDLFEEDFFAQDILATEYFQKYRDAYYRTKELGLFNPFRNYLSILGCLASINAYRPEHARSFLKRLRPIVSDWQACESIVAELLVYSYYIPLAQAGIVGKIELDAKECDLIVPVGGGVALFLEVFSLCPKIEAQALGEEPKFQSLKTHTQDAFSSVRQKLFKKIDQQGQLSKARANIAVIELNHPMIANDFSILSSLSDGYKITLDINTIERKSEGYDWTESVFDDPRTRQLKAVEWFFLGDYCNRRHLANPKFGKS